jgi:hypothetical protein
MHASTKKHSASLPLQTNVISRGLPYKKQTIPEWINEGIHYERKDDIFAQ